LCCSTRAESVALPAAERYSILWASRAAYGADGTTAYEESALDRLLVSLLTHRLAAQLGAPLPRGARADYPAFVEVAGRIQRGRSPAETHLFVVQALASLLPAWLWGAMRRLVALLTWLRFPVGPALALAAVPFAGWLVGPARVELRGASASASEPPRATTVLRRCRYLEACGCKSACINVCKAPTQAFFADVLGVPLTMTPDFDTLSCELRFGQQPPPLAEDEATKGKCFSDCALVGSIGETGSCTPPPRPTAA